MTDIYKQRFDKAIDAIVSHIDKKATKSEKQFVPQFFAKMPLLDLEKVEPKHAYVVARNAFEFVQDRAIGTPKIRLFKPTKAKHGWSAENWALQIIVDDMPFIVDSVRTELTQQGITVHDTVHPVLYVNRTKAGKLSKLQDKESSTAHAESFVHLEISPPSQVSEKELSQTLANLLHTVTVVVEDWKPMLEKVGDVLARLTKQRSFFDGAEIDEAKDFLKWLRNKNFVFLGYMEYQFQQDDEGGLELIPEPDKEMGIFRTRHEEFRPKALEALPKDVLHFAAQPEVIQITKSNRRSLIHRPVLMDYIAIKKFDKTGKVIGECRFLGLFTSTVYYQSADNIPYIRRKISRTLERANYDPLSHNGKSLKAILEFYPRDELFQISEEELFGFSVDIMALEARPDIGLFVRKDAFERFASCMVFIPRERFDSYLRERISKILEENYQGKISAFYTQLTDSPLARLHVIIQTKPGQVPDVNVDEIRKEISNVTNAWEDNLRDAMVEEFGESVGKRMATQFSEAFSPAYINHYDITSGVRDAAKAQEVLKGASVAIDFFKRRGDDEKTFHLKLYTQESASLSAMIPKLEHMGCTVVDVRPFELRTKGKKANIMLRDFTLEIASDGKIDLELIKAPFEEALEQVWTGEMEDDSFNALVLLSHLNWREIIILRAYAQYMRQMGLPYSRRYIATALGHHPKIAKLLTDLFAAKFLPANKGNKDDSLFRGLLIELDHALDRVDNLAEDRIIRAYSDLMQATLRTNYYQNDKKGNAKSYVSFKLRSSEIPNLPLPHPYAEIFVYSIQTEGVHLRGDTVARGGLRWSDRVEDFRTEVLGLMKAQMVKNAVIVPQGSKGGFVVKDPPKTGGREAFLEAGIACYKIFLRGLLDLTDNIVGKDIVPPKEVVRFDDDDPYLVVAADKGTATFSDIANSVSEEYGFWLGDAFASGGSVGYDHKAMGITARGAWVSVMRHFREMGHNTQTQDFTTVGIGDMSGDVFGNGMLLSKHIKLVAGFNHRHIFIDPTPNAAKSFKERERLFNLERSGWTDYNEKLISKGGGVFERSAKAINLSKEVREVLDTDIEVASPDELISIILKAPVDLLWNGGIGTYVKAESESHDDAGDRANNGLRVNGNELRCKVIGEGGNLGMTQLGRIEYALQGGRINTDAIDNSAGVDCSDHEVNIKIALGAAVEQKKLTKRKRDTLLAEMTEEVGDLVLIDNRLQTQALTIAEGMGEQLLEQQERMMDDLERQNFLDRSVEFLPDAKTLNERRAAGKSLSRPELAVLLSYSKLALFRDIKNSSLLDSEYFESDLLRYFPQQMRKSHQGVIQSHRLRREIIATVITNSIINRVGITFMHNIQEQTGCHPCDIARSYIATRDLFKLREVWSAIEALDGKVPVEVQVQMFASVNSFVERMSLWFLRHCEQPLDLSYITKTYGAGIEELRKNFESVISKTLEKSYRTQAQKMKQHKVPESLAQRIAGLEIISSACDIVKVANEKSLDVKVVGRAYYELGAHLRLGWLRRCAGRVVTDSYWDRLAVKSIVTDFYDQQRRLTSNVVEHLCADKQCRDAVALWHESEAEAIKRFMQFIQELKSQEHVDFAMLAVALHNVEHLQA